LNSWCAQADIPPFKKFTPSRKLIFETMETIFEKGMSEIRQYASDDQAYVNRLTSKRERDWKAEDSKRQAVHSKSLKEKKNILAEKRAEVANAKEKMNHHLEEAQNASKARLQAVQDEISSLERNLDRFGGKDTDSIDPFESSEFL